MKVLLKCLLIISLVISCESGASQSILLPISYPLVLEKLISFKEDLFKVFYGGPVHRKDKGIQWIMPTVFEDESHKTRAVYEIVFVNCNPATANGADIIFINVSDIDIKFKNSLSNNYKLFASLINGTYKDGKYVVVRSADVATVFFPDVFIASVYGSQQESDKSIITHFLTQHFKTNDNNTTIETEEAENVVCHETCNEIIYKPVLVAIEFEIGSYEFVVEKRIKKNDLWKIYYIVSKKTSYEEKSNLSKLDIMLRIDSGCISGQIYDDISCDCLDQLHDALKQIALDQNAQGMIIHIPGHDGRGFGTAPKAETEIYKIGGCGRVHSTCPLDTIAAAHLLYGTEIYDLRSFDGAAKLLQDMNITKVTLITDNITKVNSLQNNGIEVIRQKTDTNKTTCLDHIQAKKNSSFYFSE